MSGQSSASHRLTWRSTCQIRFQQEHNRRSSDRVEQTRASTERAVPGRCRREESSAKCRGKETIARPPWQYWKPTRPLPAHRGNSESCLSLSTLTFQRAGAMNTFAADARVGLFSPLCPETINLPGRGKAPVPRRPAMLIECALHENLSPGQERVCFRGPVDTRRGNSARSAETVSATVSSGRLVALIVAIQPCTRETRRAIVPRNIRTPSFRINCYRNDSRFE